MQFAPVLQAIGGVDRLLTILLLTLCVAGSGVLTLVSTFCACGRIHEAGTFYAIAGSFGAGKNTMLRLLAELDAPTDEAVRFDQKDIASIGCTQHRKNQIALVFQNYNLIDYLTPLGNLRPVNPKESIEDLTRLGIGAVAAKRDVLALSGGQE